MQELLWWSSRRGRAKSEKLKQQTSRSHPIQWKWNIAFTCSCLSHYAKRRKSFKNWVSFTDNVPLIISVHCDGPERSVRSVWQQTRSTWAACAREFRELHFCVPSANVAMNFSNQVFFLVSQRFSPIFGFSSATKYRFCFDDRRIFFCHETLSFEAKKHLSIFGPRPLLENTINKAHKLHRPTNSNQRCDITKQNMQQTYFVVKLRFSTSKKCENVLGAAMTPLNQLTRYLLSHRTLYRQSHWNDL